MGSTVSRYLISARSSILRALERDRAGDARRLDLHPRRCRQRGFPVRNWPGKLPGRPGACGVAPGSACGGAPGCWVAPGCCAGAPDGCARSCACCCCCSICLLLHLRDAEVNLPPDQHERGQHDGQDCVLLIGHFGTRSRRSARLKSSVIWSNGSDKAARRPISTSSCPEERPVAADSLTISLRRRRTRLRSTAFPTFRDTVKPIRTGPLSARARACKRNPRLAPCLRSRRPGNRIVSSAAPWMTPAPRRRTSGAEPLASSRAARGHHLAPARCRHACAKTVTAFAHQLARLIGPLHGSFSAGRQCPDSEVRQYLGTPRCELRNQRTLANLRF